MNIGGFFITFFAWLDSLLITFSNQIIKTILPNSMQSNLYLSYLFFILPIITFVKIFGSYIFEKYIQDRNKILLASYVLLSITNFVKTLLPSYEKIRIWSFIFFLILMLIKGIAIVGNYNIQIITKKSNRKCLLILGIFPRMLLTNTLDLNNFESRRIIFLISTFYSLITNIMLFYLTPQNLKKIKSSVFTINILTVIFIILSILFKISNIPKILTIHLFLLFNFLFLIGKIQLQLNKSNQKHDQKNKNLKQTNKIILNNYANIIILTLIESLQFYYISILLHQYNLINHLILSKILSIILIPIIASIADKYNAEKILKFSCFLTILSTFVEFLDIFSISIYIKIVYYTLIFINIYRTLYGYVVIQAGKKQQEQIIEVSMNVAQVLLHFPIQVLSYAFQNNIKYLSIIFQVISSLIGYLSFKIIKGNHA